MPYKRLEDARASQRRSYYRHREERLAKDRSDYARNLERERARSKKYYAAHKKERYEARLKRSKLRNETDRRRYQRIKDNLEYKLPKNIRTRLYLAIKREYKKGSAVQDLGCSIPDFKCYMETRFQDGMSWDNYGVWHIDHIQPLASFNLLDKEQFAKAVHYTNLQPLWGRDNLRKGDKV